MGNFTLHPNQTGAPEEQLAPMQHQTALKRNYLFIEHFQLEAKIPSRLSRREQDTVS